MLMALAMEHLDQVMGQVQNRDVEQGMALAMDPGTLGLVLASVLMDQARVHQDFTKDN